MVSRLRLEHGEPGQEWVGKDGRGEAGWLLRHMVPSLS